MTTSSVKSSNSTHNTGISIGPFTLAFFMEVSFGSGGFGRHRCSRELGLGVYIA